MTSTIDSRYVWPTANGPVDLTADAIPLTSEEAGGAEGRMSVPEHVVKSVLAELGVTVPPSVVVDAAEPRSSGCRLDALAAPMVLKAWGPGLLHKSDVGAVQLGLHVRTRPPTPSTACGSDCARAGITPRGFLLEQQHPGGIELIIGVVRDSTFGHVVLLGLGGIATELLGLHALRIAPLTEADAARPGDLVPGCTPAHRRPRPPAGGHRRAGRDPVGDRRRATAWSTDSVTRWWSSSATRWSPPRRRDRAGRPADPGPGRALTEPTPSRQRPTSPGCSHPGPSRSPAHRPTGPGSATGSSPATGTSAGPTACTRCTRPPPRSTACPRSARSPTSRAVWTTCWSRCRRRESPRWSPRPPRRTPASCTSSPADSARWARKAPGCRPNCRSRRTAPAPGCIGPNCLGVFSPGGRQTFTLNPPREAGLVSVISQSGGLSGDLVTRRQPARTAVQQAGQRRQRDRRQPRASWSTGSSRTRTPRSSGCTWRAPGTAHVCCAPCVGRTAANPVVILRGGSSEQGADRGRLAHRVDDRRPGRLGRGRGRDRRHHGATPSTTCSRAWATSSLPTCHARCRRPTACW